MPGYEHDSFAGHVNAVKEKVNDISVTRNIGQARIPESFIDEHHVIAMPVEGDFFDLEPEGVTRKTVRLSPGAVKRMPDGDVYVGNGYIVSGEKMKKMLDIANTGFSTGAIDLMTGSVKKTIDIGDPLDVDFFDFDDELNIETGEEEDVQIDYPVPASVVFYDEARKKYRHGMIAPKLMDDPDDYETKDDLDKSLKNIERLDAVLSIDDPCTATGVGLFSATFEKNGITPVNVCGTRGYEKIASSVATKHPVKYLKAMHALSPGAGKFNDDAVKRGIGFILACHPGLPETSECNENWCFIERENDDGFLITSKKMHEIGKCVPGITGAKYGDKAFKRTRLRDLSILTGIPQGGKSKKTLKDATTCYLKDTRGVAFKIGDEIIAYEGYRQDLLKK